MRTITLLLFQVCFSFYAIGSDPIHLLVKKAQERFEKKEYKKSLYHAGKAIKLLGDNNEPLLYSKALLVKANCLFMLNEHQESEAAIKTLLSKEKSKVAFSTMAEAFYRYACILYSKGELENALLQTEESQALLLGGKNEVLRSKVCLLFASIAYSKGNYRESITKNLDGINILENTQNTNISLLADLYYNLAIGYQKTGEYPKAVSSLQQALNDIRGHQNSLEPYINNLLGATFFKLGQHEQAIKVYNTIKVGISKEHVLFSHVTLNQGFAYLKLKKYDRVSDLIKQLETLSRDDSSLVGFIKLLKADLAAEKKDFVESKNQYYSALNKEREIGNQTKVLTLHNRLGALFLQQNSLNVAYKHLSTARSLADTLNIREESSKNYLLLHQYYNRSGNNSNAKKMFEKHLIIEKDASQDYLDALYSALNISYNNEIKK